MDNLVKIALLELHQTPSTQVVKVAGILRRVKNWLKGKIDSNFAEGVAELKEKSSQTFHLIQELSEIIESIGDNISGGDVVSYERNLNRLKQLSAKLVVEVKDITQETKEIKTRYSKEQMQDPQFNDVFKQHVNSAFDVELDKHYREPLKSFKFYQNLNPGKILFTVGATKTLYLKIESALKNVQGANSAKQLISKVDPGTLITIVQRAIADGMLIVATAKAPSEKVKNQKLGTVELTVVSAPFQLPNSSIYLQAQFILADISASTAGSDKISVVRTEDMTVINKSADRKNILSKFAEEVPRTYTSLSAVDFAKAMRKGYELTFGQDPTAEALAGGWAQAVLESGLPVKLPNNNVGNIKATPDWMKSNIYSVKDTKEFTAQGKGFTQHNAAWKAFKTPEEGAAAYWKLIGNRYSKALDWMKSGDPTSAAVELGKNHYFTADISKYSSGVSQLYAKFFKEILPQLSGLKSAPTPPPGEKPEVKQWSGQYNGNPVTAPKPIANDNSEIDNLVQDLVASGPVSSLVKQAVLKASLPTSSFLLRISSDSILYSLGYAQEISYTLQKYCRAQTEVFSKDNEVDINIKMLCTPTSGFHTLAGISDILKEKLISEKNIKIDTLLACNIQSTFNKTSAEVITKSVQFFKWV